MTTQVHESKRLLRPAELAGVVRVLREVRQWSQETLAALSGLSVRTVQRVEAGHASDIDTRRALARAFESEDIDVFNKPQDIPTDERAKAEREKFEREHLILDARQVTSGRELADLYQSATADIAQPADHLKGAAASSFAALIDYLREWRDFASEATETSKLKVCEDVQRYIDELAAGGIVVTYARRETRIVSKSWPDQTPMPVILAYVAAYPIEACPAKLAVSRTLRFGG